MPFPKKDKGPQSVFDEYRHLLGSLGNRYTWSSKTRQALQWLFSEIGSLNATPQMLMNNNGKGNELVNRIMIGKMYFYRYDPKTKDQLPYYDTFPLVFPIEPYSDGFLGINLHYLHPMGRALLLNKLMQFESGNLPAERKLELSYGLLSGAAKYKEFQPCLKRYLYSHVRSAFLNVGYRNWQMAIFLPVEQFVKEPKKTVWQLSQPNIRRRK